MIVLAKLRGRALVSDVSLSQPAPQISSSGVHEVHPSGVPYGSLFESECKQQLSLAYVRAVATAARCSVEEIAVDYQTVDLTIRQSAPHQLWDEALLDVQLKCTSQDVLRDAHLAFPLEKKHYDALRNTRRYTPAILVVMIVPPALEGWIHQDEESLRVSRAAYWTSLRGQPEIATKSTTVHVPRTNLFTTEQLLLMLSRIGNGGLP